MACDLLKNSVFPARCTPAAPSSTAPLFRLGRTVATPAAVTLLDRHGVNASTLLARHASGDFGDVHADDLAANKDAIQFGNRIFSVYRLLDDDALRGMTAQERSRSSTVWIVTNRDLSGTATVIMTPKDY